jgi:hypothetical protein
VLDGVLGAPVVEARIAEHPEAHLAAYGPHAAEDRAVATRLLHGHEVGDLGDARVGQEAGQEDVRVRQVELLRPHLAEDRLDPEAAAALVVEERREDARRVELRKAEEVDRAIGACERDRV